MAYLWFKVFHIIGVVVWFAGLFYVVRLFIYDVEANEKAEPARSILKTQYHLMEKRLFNIITTPGMVVTVVMAMGLLVCDRSLIQQHWLQVKLGLVSLLVVYHFFCGRILKQLASDTCTWTSQQLRLLNELPTVLLLAVVTVVIFKSSLPIYSATAGLLGAIILMLVGIYVYAKKRANYLEVESLP